MASCEYSFVKRLLRPPGIEALDGEFRDLLEQIDTIKQKLTADEAIWEPDVEEVGRHVYHSNAIEGNALNEHETIDVLRGATIDSKPLRDALEARNLAAAVSSVAKLAARTSQFGEPDLLLLHDLILRNIDGLHEHRGKFREVPRHIGGAELQPPEPVLVPDYMQEYWAFRNEPSQTHPVLRAILAHWWLARIHPFFDGNGRAARLVLYLDLVRAGYRLGPIVLKEQRMDYYAALAAADLGDLDKFVDFMLLAILKAQRRHQRDEQAAKRSSTALSKATSLAKQTIARQNAQYYQLWRDQMEALRIRMKEATAQLAADLGPGVVEFSDFGLIDDSAWSEIQAAGRTHDNYYFIINIRTPSHEAAYLWKFVAAPDWVCRTLDATHLVVMSVSRRENRMEPWVPLYHEAKPRLRLIIAHKATVLVQRWAAKTGAEIAETPPDAVVQEFLAEAIEYEFSR